MGRKLTQETKNKISETLLKNPPNRGLVMSQEQKDKLSVALSGSNHPKYGKAHSAETRQKMSDARSKFWAGKKESGEEIFKDRKHKIEDIHITDDNIKQIESQYEYLNNYAISNEYAYIYALCEPDTYEVRYIGRADLPKARLNEHINDYKYYYSPKTCWIVHLLKQNKVPKMLIIETCKSDEWEEREKFWIKSYRDSGSDLLNGTDGGDGAVNPSKESVLKRAKTKRDRGYHHTEEHKKHLSDLNSGSSHPQFGIPKSEETKAKISATLKVTSHIKGKHLSEEHRAKISKALKGNKNGARKDTVNA